MSVLYRSRIYRKSAGAKEEVTLTRHAIYAEKMLIEFRAILMYCQRQ